jgi:hypothetical protein
MAVQDKSHTPRSIKFLSTTKKLTKDLKIFTCFLSIAFLLNFLWEVGQAGLYQPHYEGTLSFILVHLKAALGDVAIILIIYFITALIYGSKNFIIKINKFSLFLLALLGFIFALVVEKYALATGRWSYNDLMPIFPFLKVGLTPILQLTILSPLVPYIISKRGNGEISLQND